MLQRAGKHPSPSGMATGMEKANGKETGEGGEGGEGGDEGPARPSSPGPHRRHGPGAPAAAPPARGPPGGAGRGGAAAAMAPPPAALCLFDVDGTLTPPRQASAGPGCEPAGPGVSALGSRHAAGRACVGWCSGMEALGSGKSDGSVLDRRKSRRRWRRSCSGCGRRRRWEWWAARTWPRSASSWARTVRAALRAAVKGSWRLKPPHPLFPRFWLSSGGCVALRLWELRTGTWEPQPACTAVYRSN